MTTPPVSSRQPQAAFRALRPAQLSQGRFAIMAHVLGENGKPTCGMALDLDLVNAEPADRIHVAVRCRRPGCSRRWPDTDPLDEHFFCKDHSWLNDLKSSV